MPYLDTKNEYNVLNFISETFSEARTKSSEKEIFQFLLDKLIESAEYDAGIIHLHDDVQNNLYGSVSKGFIYKIKGSSRVEIDNHTIGKVFKNGGVQIVNTDNSDYLYEEWAKKNGFKSMISIQLTDIEQKSFGVLSLFVKSRYNDEDEVFLKFFIDQTSILISSIQNQKKNKKLSDIESIITEIITTDLPLNKVLGIFLAKSLESLNGEIGFISLFSKQNEDVTAQKLYYLENRFSNLDIPKNLNYTDGQSLASWVFLNKYPYLFPSNPEIDKLNKPYQNLGDKNIENEILVPLIYEKEFIGIMVLSSTQKHKFNNLDLKFLESIATKVGQVIQSKRFYNSSLTINKFKYDKLEINYICNNTTEITNKVLDTSNCCIWLLDKREDGEYLVIQGQHAEKLDPIPEGKGISWEVVNESRSNTSEPICKTFDNIQDSEKNNYHHPEYAKKYELKSMISISIVHEKKVLGVINAYTKREYMFFDHEKILLKNISIRCASAIANSRLQNKLKELIDKWTDINTIANPGMVALTFVHDINHYIHYLTSDLDLLSDYVTPKKLNNREAVNNLFKSIFENTRLIRTSFKSLTRIGKRVKTKKNLSSIKEIIENIKQLFQRRFTRNKIKFNFKIINANDIKIECHPNEIEQLFVNLTLNSIAALNEKSQGVKLLDIKIKLDQIQKLIQIEFIDNGIGIKPNDIDFIFNIDFSTKIEGGGFGLSICRRIVEKHNGKILVKSTFGTGTNFFISLPITK